MDIWEKVVKAQKGDDNAFYELVDEKKQLLYITAFSYVKNKEDAMDIVHDTVYKAYISIKKLKEPRYFNTWLTRILINCSIDHIRKNSRLVPLDTKDSRDPDSFPASREEVLDLYNAMDKLNEKYKTIVILKYFHCMTLNEIAEVMESPLGTIKSSLNKALKELRLELVEGCDD